MVLNVERNEDTQSNYMEGFINGNKFRTMIDLGSHPVRELIKGVSYVDFNGNPINLLGYVFCEMQVGDQYIRNTRILVAKKRNKVNYRARVADNVGVQVYLSK